MATGSKHAPLSVWVKIVWRSKKAESYARYIHKAVGLTKYGCYWCYIHHTRWTVQHVTAVRGENHEPEMLPSLEPQCCTMGKF